MLPVVTGCVFGTIVEDGTPLVHENNAWVVSEGKGGEHHKSTHLTRHKKNGWRLWLSFLRPEIVRRGLWWRSLWLL